ncbi:MAG: transcription antitermination factor NusB, partial [bacterium]
MERRKITARAKPPARTRPPAGKGAGGKKGGDPVRLAVAKAYLAFQRGGEFRDNPPVALRAEADRRLYVQLLRGMVRHRRLLESEIERFSGRPAAAQDATVATLGLLGLFQLRFLDRVPPHAAVHATVALAQAMGRSHAKGWINALLRNAQRTEERAEGAAQPGLPLAVRTSHPDLLVQRWEGQLG